MTWYNNLNAKLYNSQLNKSESEIENGTQVTFWSFTKCDSNDKTTFQ